MKKKSLSKQLPPQVKRIRKLIKIVQKARGCNAQGDDMLKGVVNHLSNGNSREAKKLLLVYCNTLDLSNEHRLILESIYSGIEDKWNLKEMLRNLKDSIQFIAWLVKIFQWFHQNISSLIFFSRNINNQSFSFYDKRFKFDFN